MEQMGQIEVETLILKLSAFNDFICAMLDASQLQALAIKQTRTEFQIMQLNGKTKQLVQIFESALMLESSRRILCGLSSRPADSLIRKKRLTPRSVARIILLP